MSRLHIEFQRVQTWLFAAPRLRAMVGANTLLGETLRISLPDLARGVGRRETAWSLSKGARGYPAAIEADPLKEEDNPAYDAAEGILARDGGHFEADFVNGAETFADEAAKLLRLSLPGLRFRILIDGVERDWGGAALSNELPILAPCAWSGRDLASVAVVQGEELASVSVAVAHRHEAAKRSQKDHGRNLARAEARDLASLVTEKSAIGENKLPRAIDFQKLAGTGYMALIHADGNGLGAAKPKGDGESAAFFQANRVALRRALISAINRVTEGHKSSPLQVLMLGGDDLLVVSQSDVGLPFAIELCSALKKLESERADEFKLTLGIGLVLARPSIPIHRLHEVAERLAGSAKRRFRGLGQSASVIDWAVYTTSWMDDPENLRRRDWIRGGGDNARVLSRRPLTVLGEGLDSLEGLVAAAEQIEGKVARSQLRYLVEQLPLGRALSELAFAELPPAARLALQGVKLQEVWSRPGGQEPLVTSILDLVEILEIARLGRSASHEDLAESRSYEGA